MRFVARYWLAVVGVICLIGFALLASRPTVYGCTTYAPQAACPIPQSVTAQIVTTDALGAIGLLSLVAWTVLLIVRRNRRNGTAAISTDR